MNDRGRTATLLVVTLAAASDLHAEVMDKEPSLAHIWKVALALGVVGAVAWRWNKWAGGLASIAGALFAWSLYAEFTDPFVGSAILAEEGRAHIASAYMAAFTCALLHLAGAILGSRARSRPSATE
jgi:hypothetical protein